jgi:hypothetical protein
MASRKTKPRPGNARRDVLDVISRAALEPQREFITRLQVGKAHTILIDSARGGDRQSDRRAWALAVSAREDQARRASHAESLQWSKSITPPAPPEADYRMASVRPEVESAVRARRDWRGYVWSHAVVWDLLRRAVALLATEWEANPLETENILAAIVAEIVETSSLAKMGASAKELADGPVDSLLTEFLGAFGLAAAPGVKLWYEALMAATNPETDPAKLRSLLGLLSRKDTEPVSPEEIAQAAPLLRELVGAVRDIRSGPFLPPQEYRPRLGKIVQRWNALARKTHTLPLLCKVCWVPVLLRQQSHVRTNQGGVRSARSEVCSQQCKRRDNRHP